MQVLNSRNVVVLVGVALVLAWAEVPVRAAEPPLLHYQMDLVSDYVTRGEDIYVRRFNKSEEKHSAVNVAPALQPSLAFFGPSGMSLNLWGSFAMSDRADDNKKRILGLGRDDELDYTLAFDWSNRLGAFTAGLIYYSYFDACYRAAAPCNAKTPDPESVEPELLIRWVAPFAAAIHPTLTYIGSPTPGGWYATLGLSGGEQFFWAASLGEVAQGPKDVTVKLGYALGDLKISLDGAYRPNATLVGYPTRDQAGDRILYRNGKPISKGQYITAKNKVEDYPPAIFWITFSYSGSVAAK
jgi:hypothetical protein